jgi:hypothetical protein
MTNPLSMIVTETPPAGPVEGFTTFGVPLMLFLLLIEEVKTEDELSIPRVE